MYLNFGKFTFESEDFNEKSAIKTETDWDCMHVHDDLISLFNRFVIDLLKALVNFSIFADFGGWVKHSFFFDNLDFWIVVHLHFVYFAG